MKLRNFANILVFHSEIQDQSMVADLSVYFDVKSLSFPKINLSEISKPLHLRKLV